MVLPVSIRDANKYLKVRNYSMAIKSFQNIIKEANDYEKVLMDQVFFNLTYALGCVNLNSLYKGNIPRIAVYTAVVGPYDNLQDPLYVAENVDYFVFSDMEISSSVWHRIPLNYYNSSSVKNARFVKINPHLYFENYEISIWIDANIQLIGDVNHIASFLPDENVLGLFGHPHRNCIY
ncbi:MAG: DUF616 domain-containing protein, partial [Paraglaciecola sp.]|nr:DUF616 domain-containing protein [Paraglaciecola sp.]